MSKPKPIGVPKAKNYNPVVDGDLVVLRCSSCNIDLVNIWITGPDADLVFPAQAECPHCDGKSELTEINGSYHNGSPEDGMTVLVDIITSGDRVLYKTTKGPNAR